MEEFYKEVTENICVDFENEEVQDITNGLELLLHRFVDAMTVKFSDFKVERVTQCGSMAEKTRIKGLCGLEYDYLLEMNTWPRCGELQFRKSCEGSMQPLYKVLENHSVPLKTSVITAFRYNLCQSFDKHCIRSFCPKLSISDREKFRPYRTIANLPAMDRYNMAEGCPNCTVYMNTGCLMFDNLRQKLQFVWGTNCPKEYPISYHNDPHFRIKKYYSDSVQMISVDIHPILIVNPEKILMNHPDEEDRFSGTGVCLYLFPNSSSVHNSNCNGGGGCWRISYYDTELELFQQTSQAHRNMFMILKFITEQLFIKEGAALSREYTVKSYEVKTAVLHHIQNCKLAEPDIGPCLSDTLKLLSQYFVDNNFPNVVSAFNILNANTIYGNQRDPLWLKIIGHTFRALSDLLTTGIHSGTSGWLKDLRLVDYEVARALWCSENPRTRNWYTTITVTERREQACMEALNNYVGQRTWRAVDSLMNEYALKQLRIQRLYFLSQHGSEIMKNIYSEELKQTYMHRDNKLELECFVIQNAKRYMPKGCFI